MTTAGQQVKAPPPGWAPGLGPSPALARLLALWGPASPVPAAPQRSLAEQLSGWMDWKDAVALSQALATSNPAEGETLPAIADWAGAALARLQLELRAGFQDRRIVGDPQAPSSLPLAEVLPPLRLHHAQQQRAIASRVTGLRERLRGKLAGATPRLGQLAALDAVFERALGKRESHGLAGLQALLARRAEALQTAHGPAWPALLWAELQQALEAELELRLQPVLGLIEALHDEAGLPVP